MQVPFQESLLLPPEAGAFPSHRCGRSLLLPSGPLRSPCAARVQNRNCHGNGRLSERRSGRLGNEGFARIAAQFGDDASYGALGTAEAFSSTRGS